ncbi:hydroxyisourate hydrolase [Agromyces salentinus]|uniref:5-hydroxyisourate hydrolase n=1 Tax=Agromyces salentinus TaxID=269421 RepID=A0ABN2MDA9_9MICO|nr:hydroxyisourate hydrolase [Agromyces salentinus]
MSTSRITTHVLDTTAGRPAEGVSVSLFARDAMADGDADAAVGNASAGAADAAAADGWRLVEASVTDADGRATRLGPETLTAGEYRLRFDTGAYFAARSVDTFFPEVVVTFAVADDGRHCHVPLLLSPFAYSTYRGS